MMPMRDFRLYQAHRQLAPEGYRAGLAIVCKAPHILRPKDYYIESPEDDSAYMQAQAEQIFADKMVIKEPES